MTEHAADDLRAATEAVDIADRLRAIADLPTPAPADQHLAHHLRAAADIVEQRAGDT